MPEFSEEGGAEFPELTRPEQYYVHTTVNVRSGPGTDHDVTKQLDRNDYLYAMDEGGDWAAVYASSFPGRGTEPTGWIHRSLLRRHRAAPPFATFHRCARGCTDVQWEDFVTAVRDSEVEGWQGWVVEVERGGNDRYRVTIDMDRPGTMSVPEVGLVVGEEGRDLRRTQPVRFRGIITEIYRAMGTIAMDLKDAELIK